MNDPTQPTFAPTPEPAPLGPHSGAASQPAPLGAPPVGPATFGATPQPPATLGEAPQPPATFGLDPLAPAPIGEAPLAPATAEETAEPVGLQIAEIQQYVWSRYVKFEEAPFELDEAKALALLEDYYRANSLTSDSECFYYGILAYELAFSQPDPAPYLRKALAAFLSYRGQISSDFSFEAVDDRYEDALETLGMGGAGKSFNDPK